MHDHLHLEHKLDNLDLIRNKKKKINNNNHIIDWFIIRLLNSVSVPVTGRNASS